jgi:UDP-glucose 4-epimerase
MRGQPVHVLVTGGNGFIGRATCTALRAHRHRVTVFDPRGRTPEPGCDLYRGDIRDDVAVVEAASHVEAIIHLAGVLGTQETIANPRPAAATNILGGLNILEAAAQYQLPMVNIGVGNWFENNPYSLTKNTVERFVLSYAKYRNLRACTVRAVNAYGPSQSIAAPYGPSKVRKITPSFILRALHGDPIEIYGDGNQIMDMVWVDDVAGILVAALHYIVDEGPTDHVFEAGTGAATTVNMVAEMVVGTVGKQFPHLPQSEITHLPMRPGETPGAVVRADPKTLAPLAHYGIDPDRFVFLSQGLAQTVAGMAVRAGIH